jgi:hypothetical protein
LQTTPTTHTLDVVAANGVPFRVVYLADGMSISRPAAGKYNTDGHPLVEFYDRRYPHTPDGQFVADYRADTLLQGAEPGVGLLLQGDSPSWTVDGATMELIRFWLRRLHPNRPSTVSTP